MESTLWFWIVIAILLLIIFFSLKRYLGRVFLILLFCFVLFFVYKWISPKGADRLRLAIKNIPVSTTNFLNAAVFKNEIQLPLPSNTSSQADLEIKELPEEEKVSWFARLFGKKKKSDLSLEEPLLTWELTLTEVQLLTGEILLPQEEVDLLLEQEQAQQEQSENQALEADAERTEMPAEEEEIIYIKSNPKPAKKTQTSSPSSQLSAEDLAEARAIFGD